MKYFIQLLCFYSCLTLCSQEAVHNFGALQLHETGMVGIHTDLINDSSFNQNSGLVGFYNDDDYISISGLSSPVFFDTEIAVENGLYLDITISATNNVNLISGDIITSRTSTDISTNFLNEAFYSGENHVSLVDGYASISNKETFTFPIGVDNNYRPLTIESYDVNPLAKSAYFYENPETTAYFPTIISSAKGYSDLKVSDREFWHLEGDIISKVSVTWNEMSNIGKLATYLNQLVLVGYHKETNKWVNLGNSKISGSLSHGSLTSEEFIPNDYEVITLGGTTKTSGEFSTIDLDNYFLSPNGDGRNEFLVIDGIENSPTNNLQIFNRHGILVYSKSGYQDEFIGVSNRNQVINKGEKLEAGIYFYIIQLDELRQTHQGYLYLTY